MRTEIAVPAGLALLGAATVGYAWGYERKAFRLRRYDVPVLPAGAKPTRVLHISDIHMTPNQRLNRVLLIAGSVMALGAVVISLLAPHFNPLFLATNLGAIGLGLLMGKGFGRFMFRRILPTNK